MDKDEDEITIERIDHYNPMEGAAQRYWRASRIWREKEDSNWTAGAMIQELRDLYCFRGRVGILAQALMDDVVHDRRQEVLLLQHEMRTANDSEALTAS